MSYLGTQEKGMFFKLYFDLLFCTDQKHKIVELPS